MRNFEEIIGESPVLPVHAGVLGFPARLLGGLPVPVRIDLSDHAGRHVVVATGRDEAARLRKEGLTVLDGDEWTALAVAAESDRVFGPDLEVLLGTRGPGHIDLELALDGVRADPPRGWSVGTVLARLGLSVAPALAHAAPANDAPHERRAA